MSGENVCVCVGTRERERERDNNPWEIQISQSANTLNKIILIPHIKRNENEEINVGCGPSSAFLTGTETRERETPRERQTDRQRERSRGGWCVYSM